MILHAPFSIGPRLYPALKIGDGTLSLASAAWTDKGETVLGKRMEFGFYLDTPEFEHFDDNLQSGCGGCGMVSAFENFLSFLEAAVESYDYELRYPGSKGECTDLFPRHVVEWAHRFKDDISCVAYELIDEDGMSRDNLIEED